MDRTSSTAARPRAATPLIQRARLETLLINAPDDGVVTITAPAGSGKTTLLDAWAAARESTGGRVARVVVRSDESDPEHVRAVLLEALRDQLPFPDEEPVDLLIDNVHELRSPEARSVLASFLADPPIKIRPVLAARRNVLLGLHRMRLAGRLTEISARDLAFTDAEARELLAHAHIVLGERAAAALQRRLEGWVTGLILAADYLQGASHPDACAEDFRGTTPAVEEYLDAEVLSGLTDEESAVLQRTAVVDRFDGSLADRLTGVPGSEAVLHALVDTTGFVRTVDAARTRFEVHPVLRELLGLQLRRRDAAMLPVLHERASLWLEGHALVPQAIEQAVQGERWALAFRQLADHAFELMADGREDEVLRALRALSPADADIDANPEVAIVRASTELRHGSLLEAWRQLHLAEAHEGEVGEDRRPAHHARVIAIRLRLARQRGDVAEVEAALQDLQAEGGARLVSADRGAQAAILLEVGAAEVWAGRRQDGEVHLRSSLEAARRTQRFGLQVAALGHLAIAAEQISFEEVRQRADAALAVAAEHDLTSDPSIAVALVAAACAASNLGRPRDAADLLARTDQALRPDLEPGLALLRDAVRGLVAHGHGDLHAATQIYAAAEARQGQLVDTHPILLQVRSYRLRAQAALGDLEDVRRELAALPASERSTGAMRVVQAEVEQQSGNPGEALVLLEPFTQGGIGALDAFDAVNAQLVAARAHAALGDEQARQDAVEAALRSAEPDGLVMPFVIAGALDLVAAHPRHCTAHSTFAGLLADILRGEDAPRRNRDAAELIEQLTRSESRVLGFLPSNLTTPEIAHELFLSNNTVKAHLRGVYRKLGAHSRSEAVDTARSFGLLGSRLQ